MSGLVKSSLLDGFDLPEITHDALKSQLLKVSKTHSVKKSVSYSNLPLSEKLKVIEKEIYKVLGRYKGFVRTIRTKEDLDKYVDKSISVGVIAFDTETNNSLDPLTCKIMGLCFYIPNTRPVYVPLNHCKPGTDIKLENQVSEEDARVALQRLSDIKVIYHNAKFDTRVVKNTLGFYPSCWWDTMLAAQMLNENEIAKLKYQYHYHIDPTMGVYDIEKLFKEVPYAWVDPEIFALYAAIDAYDTYLLQQHQLTLFKQMPKLYNLFRTVEVPVNNVVANMEDNGICMDMDFVNKMTNKFKREQLSLEKELNDLLEPYQALVKSYQDRGELDTPVNFDSSEQVQILIYDILKTPLVGDSKDTSKSTLKALNTPFANVLRQYRQTTKLITSFLEPLPTFISKKDNKVHANFNQMGAEEHNVRTGRFSSKSPNLQQIPSHVKIMRLMFKASPGHVIIGGDYSQQEPRLLTHMCKDQRLIETYNNKKDLYATIGSMVFKKDYWECMEHWEDGTANPEGKEIRSRCKQLVLGIMYGMGAKLMASNLKVSVEECKQILEEFYKMFPTIRKFTLDNEQMARDLGYVEDYMGRRRHLPDINLPDIEFIATQEIPVETDVFLEPISNTLRIYDKETSDKWLENYRNDKSFEFRKKPKFKELAKSAKVKVVDNGAFISKATTQCTNARIQGGAATLTKKAMVEIYKNKELMDLGFKLLIPVHDELLGEVPIENADKACKLLAQTMINAAKPECSVDMKVDTYCVKYWYADEVSYSIKDDYMKLIKGDAKKGVSPKSEQDALKELYAKYEELNPITIDKMCNGNFDYINDVI